MAFGLYERCPASGQAVLREGSRALVELHGEWPDGLQQLREYASAAAAAAGGAGAAATGGAGGGQERQGESEK